MATLTEQMRDLTADILNGHEERRAWLGTFLDECHSDHEERKAWLSALKEEVGSMQEEHRAELGELKKEVKGMRKEFRTDQQGARRAWQEMVSLGKAQPKGRGLPRAEAHAAQPKARPRSASRRSK